jgi:predicted PP-loop superfamily ATPase
MKKGKLTDEEVKMMDKERRLHIKGKTKSYTREEAMQIIKGQRSFRAFPCGSCFTLIRHRP